MSDQSQSTLPAAQSRILVDLAGAVKRAQSQLSALRPELPPEDPADDTSPGWRQALDSIELDRLPALAEDLTDSALDLPVPDEDSERYDVAGGLRATVGHLLLPPVRQALRQLISHLLEVHHELAPALPSLGGAKTSPASRGEILAAAADLLHVVAFLREAEEQGADPHYPPEIQLVAAARPARVLVQAAVAELDKGLAAFREAAVEEGLQ